jgi:DNA-binding CsgD family transcriptional regulator
MLQHTSKDRDSSPITRIGDFAAMLRVMRPLSSDKSPDDVDGRRRMLADLCKFIAVKLGTLPPEALGFPVAEVEQAAPPVSPITEQSAISHEKLAPRLRQTLNHLLDGDSEKQVAYKLNLSPHTVHVYVKSLYRRFNVSSRAELMSRHLKR